MGVSEKSRIALVGCTAVLSQRADWYSKKVRGCSHSFSLSSRLPSFFIFLYLHLSSFPAQRNERHERGKKREKLEMEAWIWTICGEILRSSHRWKQAQTREVTDACASGRERGEEKEGEQKRERGREREREGGVKRRGEKESSVRCSASSGCIFDLFDNKAVK